jgi:phosphatidylglycerol---prolipoprotein diacylglyceryl transferase
VNIALDPVLVMAGPLVVRWGNLLALVGLGLGVWLTLREARALGIGRRPILDALAWAIPVGVLTARVVHLLGWWDYYFTRPADIWRLSPDGLSLWGGLVGGGLMAAASLRFRPGRRARILDAAAPAVALGIALGRLGMFLDGAGQGLPSDLPWATRYTSPFSASPDFGVPRHPAQLYDAFIALGMFCVLLLARRRLADGSRFWLFVVVYGTARVVLGGVRLDPPFLFGLQIEQLIAIGCVALGLVRVLGLLRRHVASSLELERGDSLAA